MSMKLVNLFCFVFLYFLNTDAMKTDTLVFSCNQYDGFSEETFKIERHSDIIKASFTLKISYDDSVQYYPQQYDYGILRSSMVHPNMEFHILSTKTFPAELHFFYNTADTVEYKEMALKFQKNFNSEEWTKLDEIRLNEYGMSINFIKIVITDLTTTDLDAGQDCGCSIISERNAKLLVSRKFTDIAVVSRDNRTFETHKLILQSSSPVFEAMILHNITHENSIQIKEFNGDTISEMLNYIYSGKYPNVTTAAMAKDVLLSAHIYQINGLKDMCEHSMMNYLTIDKAIPYIIAADSYNLQKLNDNIYRLIRENGGLKEVVKEEEWINLSTISWQSMKKLIKNAT